MAQSSGKRVISVDLDQFVRTRDALNTAFLGLSNQIDKAVKAYIDHTSAVLEGDSSLNVSYFTQPFASVAQHVLGFQNGIPIAPAPAPTTTVAPVPEAPAVDEKKKRKRNYKPRDPNAPKRPLTAYFRYLQEQRPKLALELAADPNREPGKPGDVSRIATDRWHALSSEQQAPYRAAYKDEMIKYDEEVKKYKAAGGEIDDGLVEGDTEIQAKSATAAKLGAVDDEDSSDDDSDAAAARPPPPAPKAPAKSPELPKKTPKAKKTQPNATPIAPTPQFSSINPPGAAAAPATAGADAAPPAKKRKSAAGATDEDGSSKKRGRKTKAEKAASDAAMASAQLSLESSAPEATPDGEVKKPKKKKKERKSEAAA